MVEWRRATLWGLLHPWNIKEDDQDEGRSEHAGRLSTPFTLTPHGSDMPTPSFIHPRDVFGLLFDLDGTLADSFRPIRESFNHMLRRFGMRRELSYQESLKLVGGPLEESVARLLPAEDVAFGTALFREHYASIYLDLTVPMPGATLLLEKMAERGLPQGVITNKLGSSARAIVRHFGWDRHLSLCLGEGDGLPLKPDPAMILSAAHQFGMSPDQILFVGDSPYDFGAARKAGSRIALVSTGTHPREELAAMQPDLMVEGLEELGEWLREPDKDP